MQTLRGSYKIQQTMKTGTILSLLLAFGIAFSASAQEQLPPQGTLVDSITLVKRNSRRNLVVREWNTDAKSKTKWLDHVTTYDEFGRKTEEIEYNQYGQAWRETYKYDEKTGKISEDVQYDEKDKVKLVRKYEYNPDGTKKKQYNYKPNGKLKTIKVYEYATAE